MSKLHANVSTIPLTNTTPELLKPSCTVSCDVPREKGIEVLENWKYNLWCYFCSHLNANRTLVHHVIWCTQTICVSCIIRIAKSKYLGESEILRFQGMEVWELVECFCGHHTLPNSNWTFNYTMVFILEMVQQMNILSSHTSIKLDSDVTIHMSVCDLRGAKVLTANLPLMVLSYFRNHCLTM